MLTAIVDDKWMMLAGATSGSSGQVSIVHDGAALVVTDNDPWNTVIPLLGDPASGVMHIDADGVTDAGIHLASSYIGDTKIIATGADDTIILDGGGNDTVKAYEGDDLIFGGAGDDFLDGHIGDDAISGGTGNDIIRGHSGNDHIDGGEGDDTVTFRGDLAEYDLTYVDGRLHVTQVGGTASDGTDILANVEWLEFADQTIAVTTTPSNITALANGKTLFVSGTSFDGDGYVTISHVAGSITLHDNDILSTALPVSGDISAVQHIDASGLTGAGVWIETDYTGTAKLTGTEAGDYIASTGGGDDKLKGYEGDDFLFGGAGDDFIDGHIGDDYLDAGAGNDEIRGHKGDDWIDGGDGEDVLIFKGTYSEYAVSASGDDYTITHVGGKQTDGTDTFEDIEWLQFSDLLVAVDDLILV